MRRGFFVLLLVAACAPREVPMERVVLPTAPPLAVPPAGSRAVVTPTRNQPNPFKNDQYWSGSYTCAQGETDVTLHIIHVDGTHLEAEFEFEVPNGPSGSFRTAGNYDTSRAEVRLHAGTWISQPVNYEVVDVHGTVNTSGDTIEGTVDHMGCSDFRVSLEGDEEDY